MVELYALFIKEKKFLANVSDKTCRWYQASFDAFMKYHRESRLPNSFRASFTHQQRRENETQAARFILLFAQKTPIGCLSESSLLTG